MSERLSTGHAVSSRSRFKRSFPRRLALALAALLLVAAGWVGWMAYTVLSFEDVQPQTVTDTGIVLGAALWNDRPSPALRERLNRAAELLREGKFRTIIVSGGLDPGASLTESEGMRNYLLEQGIAPEAVLLEGESTTTYENLLFSKRVMEQHGLHSATIVTHEYHAARALDIAAYVGIDPPAVSGAATEVLSLAYHRSREILALSKWKLDKLLMGMGLSPL